MFHIKSKFHANQSFRVLKRKEAVIKYYALWLKINLLIFANDNGNKNAQ